MESGAKDHKNINIQAPEGKNPDVLNIIVLKLVNNIRYSIFAPLNLGIKPISRFGFNRELKQTQ